jgi:hypothetical protein
VKFYLVDALVAVSACRQRDDSVAKVKGESAMDSWLQGVRVEENHPPHLASRATRVHISSPHNPGASHLRTGVDVHRTAVLLARIRVRHTLGLQGGRGLRLHDWGIFEHSIHGVPHINPVPPFLRA